MSWRLCLVYFFKTLEFLFFMLLKLEDPQISFLCRLPLEIHLNSYQDLQYHKSRNSLLDFRGIFINSFLVQQRIIPWVFIKLDPFF